MSEEKLEFKIAKDANGNDIKLFYLTDKKEEYQTFETKSNGLIREILNLA